MRPDLTPVAAMCAEVTPPVYCGRLGDEAALVREQQAEHEHRDEARHAEPGERRHDLVERPGREQRDDRDQQQHDDRGDEARGAGDRAGRVREPVVRAVKKPPAPILMIRAEIWRLLRTERDLEGDDQDAGDHQRPRLEPSEDGCRMRLENT